MANVLRDVLLPDGTLTNRENEVALTYLNELSAQSVPALVSSEPQRLASTANTLLLSIQDLSKRSHVALVELAVCHASLRRSLPTIAARAADLRGLIPKLEEETTAFSSSFNKAGDHPRLAARRQALLLLRNVERAVDVMELPTLLSSALSSAPPNFSSALDIYGHTQRLHSLYPSSPLVSSMSLQADDAIRYMAVDLLVALRAPSLKLAPSLRLVGWLRRILPDLEPAMRGDEESREAVLSVMFLLSRLATLVHTLDALEPLRELADQEKHRRWSSPSGLGGQQTERYLKRYIEIFREHTFGLLSMFKGVFVGTSNSSSEDDISTETAGADGIVLLPPALASFPLHLSGMLLKTLREYLPSVREQGSRDSILSQALYCAGSLGRLDGDFSLLLAGMGSEGGDSATGGASEWVEVVRRHRLLAGRLESVIGSTAGASGATKEK